MAIGGLLAFEYPGIYYGTLSPDKTVEHDVFIVQPGLRLLPRLSGSRYCSAIRVGVAFAVKSLFMLGLVLLVLLLGRGPAARADSATTATNAPLVRRASTAMLATDTGSPLQACDPRKPETGFTIEGLQSASLSGFSGTIAQGNVFNHCTDAVSDVAMLALFFDRNGTPIGQATFQPDFGLLQPGGESPFLAISPLDASQVAKVAVIVAGFQLVTAPVPVLQLTRATPSFVDGGVAVPYEVRNSGPVAAGLPRIAGRLIGTSCQAPFVVDFLQTGSPLPPGGRVTGTLFIPDGCSGTPDVSVGSDGLMPTGLSPGLSFAAVRSLYTPDGVLHVIANVCNNSPEDVYQPQFRGEFVGGPAPVDMPLVGTGIYSGDSCAPLLATVPGAPAGLTFSKLISANGQLEAQHGEAASRRDPLDDIAKTAEDAIKADCTEAELASLPQGAPYVSDKCAGALVGAVFAGYGALGYNSLLAAANGGPASLMTFAYNSGDSALATSAYRVETLGYGVDGSLLAGIDVSAPPPLGPHAWGIGETALDSNSVTAVVGDVFRIDGEGFAIPK